MHKRADRLRLISLSITMKRIKNYPIKTLFFTAIVLTSAASSTGAQIWKNTGDKIERKLEQKASNRLERKIDSAIDKGFDKVEQAPGKLNEKKKKEPTTEEAGGKATKTSTTAVEPAPTGAETNTPDAPDAPQALHSKPDSTGDLKRYQKFSFVQGEDIIAFDDFTQDAVGDLPASWISNGAAEVVQFDNPAGNWVWFNNTKGNFIPEYLKDFPNDFTIEFDLMYDFAFGTYSFKRQLSLVFSDIDNPEAKLNWSGDEGYFFLQKLAENYLAVSFDGNSSNGGPFISGWKAVAAKKDLNFKSNFKAGDIINPAGAKKPVHISISRNGRRLQVFANETKVLDLTNAFERDVKLTSARFFVQNHTEADNYYLSNIRYAVGKPDVRNKLLDGGRYSTSAITFDSGSSIIRPESYGVLKEIAEALKGQTGKTVRIVGHTDSDGSEKSNLELSERRAEAVKKALEEEFSVGLTMITEGKGEASPITDNNSAAGKAQNRRVEFVLE